MTRQVLLLLFIMIISPSIMAETKFDLFLETGAVWQGRNDAQIPPSSGTLVNIDEYDDGPFLHSRLEAYYRFNNNHAIRAVYAPFDIDVSGRSSQTVNYNGTSFSAGQDLNINYQFNSYRLSYVYGLRGFGNDQLNIGFTLKVRDADITFSQGGLSNSYDNLGLVPLFYFEYQKNLSKKWYSNLTIDAAAASQGRAIDAAFKLRRRISNKTSIGLGYRTLEGGADNDEVYTFSWFHYAIVDLHMQF